MGVDDGRQEREFDVLCVELEDRIYVADAQDDVTFTTDDRLHRHDLFSIFLLHNLLLHNPATA